MKKLTAILFHLSLLLFTFVLSAAIPLDWDVEVTKSEPAVFYEWQGGDYDFNASLKRNGKPFAIDLQDGVEPRLYWQTNGMDHLYWSVPASVEQIQTTFGPQTVFHGKWLPEMETGNQAYNCFIGITGMVYNAAFKFCLRKSPGAHPNDLPLPVKTLDFAQVQVLNAPYYSKSETDARIIELSPPADLSPAFAYTTAVSNKLEASKQDVIADLNTIRSGAALGATAVQPAAISDMETQTHAGGTYLKIEDFANYTGQVNTRFGEVDAEIQEIEIDMEDKAPLQTLYNELNNHDTSTTAHADIRTVISGKLDKSGGTMTGSLIIDNASNLPITIGRSEITIGDDGVLPAININPLGFWFNGVEQTSRIDDKIDAETGTDIAQYEIQQVVKATNPTFSNAVLAVGLNIDTNSVAQINAILNDLGGIPIEGTATTVGGLLLALAAAVAWLKKNKANKASNPTAGHIAALDADGNPTDSGKTSEDIGFNEKDVKYVYDGNGTKRLDVDGNIYQATVETGGHWVITWAGGVKTPTRLAYRGITAGHHEWRPSSGYAVAIYDPSTGVLELYQDSSSYHITVRLLSSLNPAAGDDMGGPYTTSGGNVFTFTKQQAQFPDTPTDSLLKKNADVVNPADATVSSKAADALATKNALAGKRGMTDRAFRRPVEHIVLSEVSGYTTGPFATGTYTLYTGELPEWAVGGDFSKVYRLSDINAIALDERVTKTYVAVEGFDLFGSGHPLNISNFWHDDEDQEVEFNLEGGSGKFKVSSPEYNDTLALTSEVPDVTGKANFTDLPYNYGNYAASSTMTVDDGKISRIYSSGYTYLNINPTVTLPVPATNKTAECVLRWNTGSTVHAPTLALPSGKTAQSYSISGDTPEANSKYEMFVQIVPTSTTNTYEVISVTRKLA